MDPLASANITASAAGNGILILIACILFFVAAGVALFLAPPRNWWAILVSAGLAVWTLALLFGG